MGLEKYANNFGLYKTHNAMNLVSRDYLYLTEGIKTDKYKATSRIGIKKALDKQ